MNKLIPLTLVTLLSGCTAVTSPDGFYPDSTQKLLADLDKMSKEQAREREELHNKLLREEAEAERRAQLERDEADRQELQERKENHEKWVKSHTTDKQAIKDAIRVVKSQLKDPDSAKFKDVLVMKDKSVTGLVNAKNSYGGYTGYTRFLVTSSVDVELLE